MVCSKYSLLTEPTLLDFLHEKLITIVHFSIAILAIYKYSGSLIWLLIYFGIIGTHIIHILLQRCPHCEYYHCETKRLECLWWRWVPKIKDNNSGPLPKYLGIYTPVAVLVITLCPIYWLTFQLELVVFYVLSWGVLAFSIYTSGCSRCIDFKRKNNLVPKALRDDYLLEKSS